MKRDWYRDDISKRRDAIKVERIKRDRSKVREIELE